MPMSVLTRCQHDQDTGSDSDGGARDTTHQQARVHHENSGIVNKAWLTTGSQAPVLAMMPEPTLTEGH